VSPRRWEIDWRRAIAPRWQGDKVRLSNANHLIECGAVSRVLTAHIEVASPRAQRLAASRSTSCRKIDPRVLEQAAVARVKQTGLEIM